MIRFLVRVVGIILTWLRFLARLVGTFLLAIAVVFAAGDIARSLTENGMYLTPLAEAAGYFGAAPPEDPPEGGAMAEAQGLWNFSAAWPASPSIGLIALLLLFLGRPRRRGRDGLMR